MANRKPDKCPANPDHPVAKDYKGIVNVMGAVKGRGNSLMNFGNVEPARIGSRLQTHTDLKQKAELAKMLAEGVHELDRNSNDSAEGSNAPADPRIRARGVVNVDGDVDGVGDAGVNFGNMLYDDAPENSANTKARKG